MSRSLVFTYNIRRSLFVEGINTFFKPHQLKLSDKSKLVLLPVVTNLGDGIQYRAKELTRLLPNILDDNQSDSCHLVSFSLSGLDARLALSHFGLDKYVRSLTTVGTPHKGAKLAWLSQRQIFTDKKCEPLARFLGVGLRPFWQVTPENMIHFNNSVKDVPSTKYFSIGGEKLPNSMNIHLRQTGNYLRNKTEINFVYQNDGIVGHDQCHWGTHLVNFEADHSELLGLNEFGQLSSMLQLIEDAAASVSSAAV